MGPAILTAAMSTCPTAVTVRASGGLTPPIAALKSIVPLPAARVRVSAAVSLTVLLKVMLLFVVVRTVLSARVTAPVYSWVPAVVTDLKVIPPFPVTFRLVRAVPLPTTPPKLTVPAPASTVSTWPPSTVVEKVTALFVVVRTASAARLTAPV